MDIENHCIIHYNDIHFGDKLISIKSETFITLKNCQQIREDFGGINHHLEQCSNIPQDYDKHLKYHRRCYQKFTNVKHLTKQEVGRTK